MASIGIVALHRCRRTSRRPRSVPRPARCVLWPEQRKRILSISDLGSTTLPLGFQFALIENTSTSATTGTFRNLPEGATVVVGSNQLAVFYDAVLGGDGTTNDVVLKVVPEPASGALLGVGALVAGLARRRLRRRGYIGG